MESSPNIAKIGSLLGDNTRAKMLSALMHGKALTATELANEAGVTAQTATSHLAKLETGGLLTLQKQGRHKYFALASEEVANLLESLMGISAGNEPLRVHTGPRDPHMREARVCYNHLAGDRGIQLYDSLLAQRFLLLRDGSPRLTKKGNAFFTEFGIDLTALQRSKSPLCRPCLDWSARRNHLAGSLGRALYSRLEELRWVSRDGGRTVTFSRKGQREFEKIFPA